ncbi:MAG: hypothetical protein H0U90_10515 [Actinobacteria bacterium]|nr:hypothetical protein [Actinomycetota bacterium]
MAGSVTWDEVRSLAGVEARSACAISLYVNLDPSVAPTPGGAQTRVNSLLDEASKSAAATRDDLSHDARQALRTDFDRIRRYFDQEFVRDGSRGAVVFCASLDGIWVTRELVAPVSDQATVGRELLLTPLVRQVGCGEGALVVMASREQGRFYELQGGRLEELADLSDRQPRRHDQGGWSQARMQRHVDELASEHLREVAEGLDFRVREAHGDVQVVVVAPEETRAELSNLLSQEAQRSLVGWTHAEAHAGPADLLEVALPVIERARADREERLVERWREEAGRGARASAGWADTLEAVSDGRVETLLASDAAAREAWRCPQCRRLSASEGACPLDGTAMELVENGLDAAMHRALVQGGTVWIAEHARDLDPVEGLGALLRF